MALDTFHLSIRAILDRPRDITLTVDARLLRRAAALLAKQLGDLRLSKGAVVVDVATGDVLGWDSSAPWPRLDRGGLGFEEDSRSVPELPLLDRVRYGHPARLHVQAACDGGGRLARLVEVGGSGTSMQVTAPTPRRHAACRSSSARSATTPPTTPAAAGTRTLDEGLRMLRADSPTTGAGFGLAVGRAR